MSNMQDREASILMIQWAIWKHLGEKLILDGERMQHLAQHLAYELYDEGMRLPLDDDDVETPLVLANDVLVVSREVGPVPIPEKHLRLRVQQVGKKLYGRGWRKFAVSAAGFLMFTFLQ